MPLGAGQCPMHMGDNFSRRKRSVTHLHLLRSLRISRAIPPLTPSSSRRTFLSTGRTCPYADGSDPDREINYTYIQSAQLTLTEISEQCTLTAACCTYLKYGVVSVLWEQKLQCVGCEVFTAVTMKNTMFWDRSVSYHRTFFLSCTFLRHLGL
jgi:hypothetical protein